MSSVAAFEVRSLAMTRIVGRCRWTGKSENSQRSATPLRLCSATFWLSLVDGTEESDSSGSEDSQRVSAGRAEDDGILSSSISSCPKEEDIHEILCSRSRARSKMQHHAATCKISQGRLMSHTLMKGRVQLAFSTRYSYAGVMSKSQ